MARGILRVYLGAAPGVGKTFAMLDEGWRRHERGTDVVIGIVETHGRPKTAALLRDLEVIPRKKVTYRGTTLEEFDVDSVLKRRPKLAVVDELAHTNVPGSCNVKRWQDIDELLAAGIDVISTVNIQHLESLNDVVEKITGITQRETVPDAWVREADQIELVDMSPEALRRRMAHGNIYPPERVDAALGNYFRPGNLAALRELALLWVADRVEEYVAEYQADHGISKTWETRERVVVAITGAPGGEGLIRRAARMAGRAHGDLVGVHVVPSDGLSARQGTDLDSQRVMLDEMGGAYREVVGDDISTALAEFARAEKATQLVLGASGRSRLTELTKGSVINEVIRKADGIDVHVISTARPDASSLTTDEETGLLPRLRRAAPVAPRRVAFAAVLAAVGLPLLTAALVPVRDDVTLATLALLMLAAVVIVAALGGLIVGLAAAVGSSLLLNWYFVEPYNTLNIGEAENVVALIVFVMVAVVVSLLVDRAATQAREARVAGTEAEALARTTGTLVGAVEPLPELLDQIRSTFRLDAVAVLMADGDGWRQVAATGGPAPSTPAAGTAIDLGAEGVLVLVGPKLPASAQRVLRTFAAQLAVALANSRLRAVVARADADNEANELRTALLQAVSHDLRTPLSSIKAAVSSMLLTDVDWDEAQRKEFLTAIDEEADRLDRVVGNLLDMGRLQSGAVQLAVRPVFLEDVVAAALANVQHRTDAVHVSVPETVTPVAADAALLERALANVISNALQWSPPSAPVRIEAAALVVDGRPRVHLRVIDRGPGIPPDQRERVFEPFQRLGDSGMAAGSRDGVGLGLAVARGFISAMDGELTLDDTPGGGLTVTIDLPESKPV